MQVVFGILNESYTLLNEMAVYLLFGFFFAGIIHIFLKTETVVEHLGKNDFASVVKASLFGIPLPLCSCGVIPAALSLRKQGAGKGAVLSFLVSTPTTGIDSIMATYALLGGFFAFYRVLASLIAGIFVGVIANIFLKPLASALPTAQAEAPKSCCHHHDNSKEKMVPFLEKVRGVFSYGFGQLLKEIGPSLIVGILIAGVISYLIPETFVQKYLANAWMSMAVMFVIGIPMYVCSTGSIPIAVALMLKGMNPAAAFVFLLTGPATNAVALFVIARQLGIKAVCLFLISLVVSAFGLGILLNVLWNSLGIDIAGHLSHQNQLISPEIKMTAGIVLLGLIVWSRLKK